MPLYNYTLLSEARIAEIRVQYVDNAISLLRIARDLLAEAQAPKATAKVRAALRSAEGAKRNAIVNRTKLKVANQVEGYMPLSASQPPIPEVKDV